MSVYKKFTKDVGLIAFVHLLTVAKIIIFLPLITKLLGAFSYGIWTQLLVTAGLLAPLTRLGLTNSIVRYMSSEKDHQEIKKGIYSVVFVVASMSFLIFLAFIVFIGPISTFFQAPMLFIFLLPFIIALESLNATILSVFQAFQKMTKYSFFVIFASMGELLFVIASIYLGYGLLGAVFSLLIIRIITFLLLYGHIYKTFGFSFPEFTILKKYLRFSLPTLLSNTSYWFVTSIDKYLIGFFLGTLFVGYYAPAYSLGNLITFFIIPISFVLFPTVSKAYDEENMVEVKNKLKYSLKYFLILAIPATFGLSVLMKEILRIFTNPEIAQQAFFITPFIASSILFYGVSDIFSQILTLVKKTKTIGFIWVTAAILNIALNIFLIPTLGILGAAIATLTVYVFAFLAIWHYSFKEFTFGIDWFAIVKILLCSGLMSLIVWQINPRGIFNTIATIIIGAICYALLIIITRVFEKKEFTFLKGLTKGNL